MQHSPGALSSSGLASVPQTTIDTTPATSTLHFTARVETQAAVASAARDQMRTKQLKG